MEFGFERGTVAQGGGQALDVVVRLAGAAATHANRSGRHGHWGQHFLDYQHAPADLRADAQQMNLELASPGQKLKQQVVGSWPLPTSTASSVSRKNY